MSLGATHAGRLAAPPPRHRCHLFESQSKAKASGGAKVAIAGGRAVLASGKGKTLALLAKGVFLTSVVAMGDDSEVQAAVTALLKSIASVK